MPRQPMKISTHAPHVITLDDVRRADEFFSSNPDDPSYRYRILAEGDSWFSIGAIPSSNLLFEMQLPGSTLILNLAYPGDTIENMSSLASNPDLRKMIFDNRYGYRWDLILISGGGNDLINCAGRIIVAPAPGQPATMPENYINQEVLSEFLDDVEKSYRQLVAVRDEPECINAGKPIVVHTYDYPTPRNAPARFVFAGILGPWLYPVLQNSATPEYLWIPITDHLIDALAERLLTLSNGPSMLPNFHVVDTRGMLEPAGTKDAGNSNDWLNEIHPNHQGYRKLASKISEKVTTLL